MTISEIGWFTAGFYDDSFLARFNELAVEFNLPMGARIKTLSKGQRSKVSLALATAHDPKLLILDEPTSGLDPMVRRKFLESMVDRAASGCSVLLSSHHINEVERIADWIAILHQGEMKLVKPLSEIHDTIAIVTVTTSGATDSFLDPAGTILSATQHQSQKRWVVQDLVADWRESYQRDEKVTAIEMTPATLEDVFIALCDERPIPLNSNLDAENISLSRFAARSRTSETTELS